MNYLCLVFLISAAFAEGGRSDFEKSIQSKLEALHSYYLIGHQNLQKFDERTDRGAYLKLLAVYSQVSDLEDDLEDAYRNGALGTNKLAAQEAVEFKLNEFAAKGIYQNLAVENLSGKLGLKLKSDNPFKNMKASPQLLEAELELLEGIYAKNIESMAASMSAPEVLETKVFSPSTGKEGNIFGHEFPEKVWSLTFDDGPKKATSRPILKALKEKKLRATFFQLTEMVKADLKVSHEIRDAGHEIASHSWSHKKLTAVSAEELEHQITKAGAELGKLQEREIKLFRLPYGAGVHNEAIRKKIAANNWLHVFWTIDTLDWMPQEPIKIVNRTLKLMKEEAARTKKDAGVILFHDVHERTTKASPLVMDYLKKDGRRVCTIGQIVSDMNAKAEKVCPN